MTNKDLLNFYNGLVAIKQNTKLSFSAKASYAIARNLRVIEPVIQDLIAVKDSLLSKYGTEEDDKIGVYRIPPEKIEDFNQENEALDKIDNAIQLYKISWSDIEDKELSVETMDTLMTMLEEE